MFNPYLSNEKTHFADNSRTEPTIVSMERISYSLKLLSGHLYGQCPRSFENVVHSACVCVRIHVYIYYASMAGWTYRCIQDYMHVNTRDIFIAGGREAKADRLYNVYAKHTSNLGFYQTFMPCSGYISFAAEQRVGYKISWVDIQREVICP